MGDKSVVVKMCLVKLTVTNCITKSGQRGIIVKPLDKDSTGKLKM